MAGTKELQTLEDESWEFHVQNNLTYLTEKIEDLTAILTRLVQHKIISDNERQYILNELHHPTKMNKNDKLLTTLRSKDWLRIKPTFAQILRETLNYNCADLIEFGYIKRPTTSAEILHQSEVNNQHSIQPANCAISHPTYHHYSTKTLLNGTINSKWWPEEIRLPTSFFERKTGSELLTEKLKKMLTQNKSKITVINQQVAVSGLGGIGKTTTAKSFALKYAADYNLIIWIDCGEGSLINSFENLARDLSLENRKELKLKELASRSFEILKESKCLFIFDNAECYVGKDGIRDVLPKNHNKFHVVITSRNRHWGQENIDGIISEFQLDVFDESEGLKFMKKYIKGSKKNDEMKIKTICSLLSYLPLALQIAVATLNKHNITLDRYIQKLKTTDDILDANLDDYERTIKKTLNVTLELIQMDFRKDIGETAIQILSIFGYITPDAVDSDFFMAVKCRDNFDVISPKTGNFSSIKRSQTQESRTEINNKEDFDEATDLLQFYSIIVKSNISEGRYKLSIHRLFQQVIRYNTKGEQNQILRQIFNCKRHLEYKLIPFIYYADEELKQEFLKLKAELIDKLKLKKLLGERRFQEAVELSQLIKESIKTPVSIFNFALCLKYNHENEEAKKILRQLLNNTKKQGNINEIVVEYDSLIMNSDKELTFDIVAWALFLIYCEEKDEKAAKQIFLSATQMKLSGFSFNSSVLSLLPQSLKILQLFGCTVTNGSSPNLSHIRLPSKLEELILYHDKFVDDHGKEYKSLDISQLISANLKILEILGSIYVSLERMKLIPSVDLWRCNLILVPGLYITPEELTLGNIKFCAAVNEPIANVLVNDFVTFRQIKRLQLIGNEMSIDLCDPLTLNHLYLCEAKVVDWKKANWTVRKLLLDKVDFVDRTRMEVTEMEIHSSSVDISVLPSTIQKLHLFTCTLVNFSFSPIHEIKPLPNLNQLYLKKIKINKKKAYANNDALLRFLVPNCDKWTKINNVTNFGDDYLDAHKN